MKHLSADPALLSWSQGIMQVLGEALGQPPKPSECQRRATGTHPLGPGTGQGGQKHQKIYWAQPNREGTAATD